MLKPAWTIGARTGPLRNYMQLKVFACEGLICIVDEREGGKEGEFTVVLPIDLEHRVRALNQPYRGRTRVDMPVWQRQEHDMMVRGSQECIEAVKEARAMGDPSDPKVQMFWQRHRRSSTVRIRFSAGADPAGYPLLPEVPLGNITGKTADAGVPVLPTLVDQNAVTLHRAPRRKNRSGLIILD